MNGGSEEMQTAGTLFCIRAAELSSVNTVFSHKFSEKRRDP